MVNYFLVRRWATLIPLVLLLIPQVWAALSAYPLYDDGWLMLLTKEVGPQALQSSIPDRPLFAAIQQLFANTERVELFVTLGVLLWSILAWETAYLWRFLLPAYGNLAPLAGVLALAPIIVDCQFTTITTDIPSLLPVVLAYGGILLLESTPNPTVSWRRFLPALLLVAFGMLVSEYAIAALLCGSAIFASRRFGRKRGSQSWLGPTALGLTMAPSYMVYRWLSQLDARPDVSPGHALDVLQRDPVSIVLNLLSGVWRVVVGGYGSALGAVGLDSTSKSTWVSTFFALLLAAVLVACCRPTEQPQDERREASRIIPTLMIGLFAGLVPVAVMGRSTILSGFGSRFLIPVLPIAVVCTVAVVVACLSRPAIRVAVFAFGFLAGNAAMISAVREVRDANLMRLAGQELRKVVEHSRGTIVAVASLDGIDYQMTAQATRDWPAETSKRLWIFDRDAGEAALGLRSACNGIITIQLNLRTLVREGEIASRLWLDFRHGRLAAVQGYCVPSETDSVADGSKKVATP